ncbi:hypothetical protein [Sphingomonas bacterium]|uniref:hypothetical protein n=1 Tax=Sphingomonas bacterium TaxID=1895847 RepID=UPI00157722B7|nr:hypothetical protein [Sphingomonas bacterium]
MKRRVFAEAAVQITLFLMIVTLGFGTSELFRPLGGIVAHLIGAFTTTALTMTVLFNWSRILERFWPRSER